MKLARSQIAVLLFLLLLCSVPAHADNCTTTPTGSLGPCTAAGQWDWDVPNQTYKFCDGADWFSVKGSGSLGACTTAGQFEYDTGNATYKFCNGSDWIPVANNGTLGACPTEAHREYDTGNSVMKFCDPTNWIDMTSSAGTAGKCIFVSSTTGKGNWKGALANFDAECQTLADAATPSALGGTYKAWISNSTTNATDRLTHSTTPYVQVDGTKVADDWADLIDGEINFTLLERDSIIDATNLDGAWDLAMSDDGNTLFVAVQETGTMAVVDVTDPSAITYTTKITGITGARAVDVEGSYAYVVGTNVFQVVDIVGAPIFPSGGNSGTLTITGAYEVVVDAVAGYAYVSTDTTNTVVVVNISTKNTPTIATTVTHATDLAGAKGIALSSDKNYLFVAAHDANKFTVIDVSTPASAAWQTSIANSASAPINNALLNPVDVAVSGNFAYTLNPAPGDDSMGVIDVTNGAIPVFQGAYKDTNILNNSDEVGSLAASGTNVFVTSFLTQSLVFIDASIPTAPVYAAHLRASALYLRPRGPAIFGNYVYVPGSDVGPGDPYNVTSFEFNTPGIFSAIALDEDGVSRAGDGVWTGTTTAALYAGTACTTAWSSGGGGSDGTSGIAGNGSGSWTNDSTTTACTASNHVYCLEQ